ncbi:hypothetical protein FQA39_LY01500 [Lamprigera yunnana]|nr:hypothetical protein FQA39_LY01500 [Lamprigera yunnana]
MLIFVFSLFLTVNLITTNGINGFDDAVLFDINWPGADEVSVVDREEEDNIVVSTKFGEKYKCSLPNIQVKEPTSAGNYDGPNALELITPLFSQSSCSYRLESYWTYEVCHGKHIRQYHEHREGKKVKVQEYNLGLWAKNQYQVVLDEMKLRESENKNAPLPVKKIDGISLPYFEILMGNGTQCELNQNKPRQTKVIYVCYIHGKHEIFSLKEISTCMYEVIILSPLLCSHPRYKPQESGENEINCVPLDGSPKRPRTLMKTIQENKKLRRRSDLDHIRLEFHPLDLNEKEEAPKPAETPIDASPVESFLAGKNCLNGGTGWWKYEFCYGKSVEQYHIERDGSKISINLGKFNKAKHLEWIFSHPQKRPKPKSQRTQLSHLYSDGSLCDKTVTLYLLEPRYCEYILGVESPLICDILARADENGLVENPDEDGFIEEEISTVNIVMV